MKIILLQLQEVPAMCNQLKVEFLKLRRFELFYFGMILMIGLGSSYGFNKFPNASIYDGFVATLSDTSFMFVPALISAWFVGNDFSNRTIHNEITTGCSRLSVLFVRELPTYLSVVTLHFIYVVSTAIAVGVKNRFSFDGFCMQDLCWCAAVILQLIAMQSIIVLITFICAKAASAIAVSVCFIFLMCNILRNFFEGKFYTMSCFCLARNNSYETLIPTGIVAAFIIIITVILTWLVFRKKEIK